MGQLVKPGEAKVLRQFSKEQYEREIRRIRNAPLLYRKADLEEDFDDHAPGFGIDSKEEYLREARHVVRTSHRILAKNYAGDVQYEFFGRRGFVVVDRQARIRGYYEHVKRGAVEKAFDNLRRIRLWLKIASESS